jgi:23S rRNA pseudouridine1911/1915/1917 synthase
LTDATTGSGAIEVTLVDPAGRLDRALTDALPDLSRARVQALMLEGAVTRDAATMDDPSGVMVAAKTDLAHRGLSALFAAHDLDRAYVALTRGAPTPAKGTVITRIGRSTKDRKKMAVLAVGGREAVTHYALARAFGSRERPLAARVNCTLETGRTHQIRVHLAHKGAPCLGDPTYGAGAPAPAVKAAMTAAGLKRQALHAALLAFRHPVTHEPLRFETAPPDDMARLETALEAL